MYVVGNWIEGNVGNLSFWWLAHFIKKKDNDNADIMRGLSFLNEEDKGFKMLMIGMEVQKW